MFKRLMLVLVGLHLSFTASAESRKLMVIDSTIDLEHPLLKNSLDLQAMESHGATAKNKELLTRNLTGTGKKHSKFVRFFDGTAQGASLLPSEYFAGKSSDIGLGGLLGISLAATLRPSGPIIYYMNLMHGTMVSSIALFGQSDNRVDEKNLVFVPIELSYNPGEENLKDGKFVSSSGSGSGSGSGQKSWTLNKTAVQAEAFNTEYSLADKILRANPKISVVNMSFGEVLDIQKVKFTKPHSMTKADAARLYWEKLRAIEEVQDRFMDSHPNVLFIIAAGNDGVQYKRNARPNAIYVCALDSLYTNRLANFSNYGSEYTEICARGESVPGASALAGLTANMGTSFAAPLVANFAYKLSLEPGAQQMTGAELKKLVLSRANVEPFLVDKVADGRVLPFNILDYNRNITASTPEALEALKQRAVSLGR